MMDNGNEVIDKEMDIIDLLLTVRQMKTFIQKNFIEWKKLKQEVPKDEAKLVLKLGGDESETYRIKNKKTGDKYLEEKDEVELASQKQETPMVARHLAQIAPSNTSPKSVDSSRYNSIREIDTNQNTNRHARINETKSLQLGSLSRLKKGELDKIYDPN